MKRVCSILAVVFVLTAAGRSAYGLDQLTWTQVDNASPTPRYFHAMAVDRDRNVLVLFGGNTGETDTWEWNTITKQWRLAAPAGAGPSRRGGHAMAYDPIRHVTVLAGGFYNGTEFKDVWEWNGTTWTQRTGSAQLPEVRSMHAMAFDASQGKIVLYGGTSSLPNGVKTLVYDGVAWTPVTTATNPGVQDNLALAYDTSRGVTVLATAEPSGNSTRTFEYGLVGGVWDWQLESFATTVPGGREYPRMVFDEARGVCVFRGGISSHTWTYDGTVWTRVATTGPSTTREALAYDPLHAEVLMYFGNGSGNSCECNAFRQLHAWNGTGWSLLWQRTSLDPNYMAGVAFDENRSKTVLYGGRMLNPSNYSGVLPFDQTWEWDGTIWTKIESGTNPGHRCEMPLVYDSNRQVSVLYGGLTNDLPASAVASTWEYDGTDWHQGPDGPGRRWRHAAAFDRARNKLVVFGGRNEVSTDLGDTWEYDGVTWAQVATTGPSARSGAMMAFDAAHARIVLFGGAVGSTLNNETWAWNGTTWTRLDLPTDVHPPTRQSAGFSYNPDRGQIVMYAGRAGATGTNISVRNDLWVLDGTQWTQLSTPTPIAKAHVGFVYDTVRHRFVLAGGSSLYNDNFITAQTWEARFPCLGDVTNNGSVNVDDLLAVINGWGACPALPAQCLADIAPAAGNGVVNVDDLLAVINAWGACQ